MTIQIDSGSEFQRSGRSYAERTEVLEELRKQLPPAGLIAEKGTTTPFERYLVMVAEFLHCMLKGKPASARILNGHPAFGGRNYIGQWCKKIGLQFSKVGGKTVYPATGANMMKLIIELNTNATDELERIAEIEGMSVDWLVDFAIAKFYDEFLEVQEPVDEFMDLPEDFQVNDPINAESVNLQIEQMLGQFKSPEKAVSATSSQLENSKSATAMHDDAVAISDAVSILNDRDNDFDPQRIEEIVKSLESPQDSDEKSAVVSRSDYGISESCPEHSLLVGKASEQSPG